MKALIIGATGATGMPLVQQLLNDDRFSQITIFVRKSVNISHPKLNIEIIDFDNPNDWADKVVGDVLFSCLGTTLKQAGNKENQRKIDFDYPLVFANIAKQNGIARFLVLSSDGANADSRLFYYRLKGELETALQNIGLTHLTILRPPLLKRPNSDRFNEKFAEKLIETLNHFGLLLSQKPMPTEFLAMAMINSALENKTGILKKDEIWTMIDKNQV